MADFPIYCHIRYDAVPNKDGKLEISCTDVSNHDFVEVVRCRDCRYYYKDAGGYEMCDNSEGYDHISADGFCAWAERRIDNV